MTRISEITDYLETFAPLALQEDYDNAGLITGSPATNVEGILITLDCTEDVIEEAIRKSCNLIIAHHPIVFKGLKKLNGKNYVERTIIKAIKNDIAIYAIHTNLDNVKNGVNFKIAGLLGLRKVKILAPAAQKLVKLTFFTPAEDAGRVLHALYQSGAGEIGNYAHCSFSTAGTGTFMPNEQADPTIGKAGQEESVQEIRSEVMFPDYLKNKILNTLKSVHPYEEVAYYLQDLKNENQEIGAGAIGELPGAMPVHDFLAHVKKSMPVTVIRYTETTATHVRKIAVCGGSGSFLLQHAKRAGADVYLTADFKYHEFFDGEKQIMICDIGHYESEVNTKELLLEYISKKFSNFALCLSDTNTNPVHYFI